jgi:hypothetical protein
VVQEDVAALPRLSYILRLWVCGPVPAQTSFKLGVGVWLTLFVRGVVWTLSLALNEPGPCEHSSPSRVLFKHLHVALKLVAVAVAFVQPS